MCKPPLPDLIHTTYESDSEDDNESSNIPNTISQDSFNSVKDDVQPIEEPETMS